MRREPNNERNQIFVIDDGASQNGQIVNTRSAQQQSATQLPLQIFGDLLAMEAPILDEDLVGA